MSVENCNYRCEVDDYLLSGVEFGHECWCDHALNGEYHVKVDDSECNMECSGNSMQSCGGANRIAIYEYNFTQVVTVTTEKPSPGGHGDLDARSVDIVSLYAPIGCYIDSVTARMLRNYTVSPGAAQALNVGICTTACYDLAFPYAGLEFAQECFCDTLMQTIVKAPEAECNMTCSGDTGEICGGDLRINIYSYNGTTPLTATSTTAMPTTASSVTSTSTNLAITAPGAYKSLGCYSDITSNRTLGFVGDYPGAHGNMTIEPCQGACENAGYVFAGVEFGDECWCDNVIRGIGTSVSSTDCNMPCSGNTSETCGGSNRINVYRFTPSGSFVPIGCYTDSRSNRTLGFVGDFPGAKEEGMIIEPCQGACQNAGYVFAGVEFGTECWCDNVIRGIGVSTSDSDCNMPCSGNTSETCGGSNRINVYQLTSTMMTNATTSITTTSTESCSAFYMVAKNDYCYEIWTSFGISQDEFTSWNPTLVFPVCQIFPGDFLCVQVGPGSTTTVMTLPAASSPTSNSSISSTTTITGTIISTVIVITSMPSSVSSSSSLTVSPFTFSSVPALTIAPSSSISGY